MTHPKPRSGTTLDQAIRATRSVLERKGIEGSEIAADTSFEELGFDSMDIVELFTLLEDESGARLESALVETAREVRDVVTDD